MNNKKNNKKLSTMIILMAAVLLLPFNVLAHGEETFTAAEQIIQQKIPCNQLTDDQLEQLGDYYMEQMHPGEAHVQMDEMMGGEGSESLKQMHIRMAESFYCGNHDSMTGGMMNMMMGRNGVMDAEIIEACDGGSDCEHGGGNMMGYGMNYGMGYGFFGIFGFIIIAIIFSVIFWGTYKLIIKNNNKK